LVGYRSFFFVQGESMTEHAATAHGESPRGGSLNRVAFSATVHCLTGCAIGEIVGLAIATALGWGNLASIALAIALAFVFGYSLTLLPVLRAGVPLRRALPLAFASDTASISVMEAVDNGFILIVPGAMEATLGEALFWWSLLVGLVIAFFFAYPLNRWLIARGKGHAVVHAHHGH
jgi:predicted neutral ceramidase superfamily lipid hydrolase